jgi:tricorn protease
VELPYAFRGAFSPDGKRIAYNPLYDAFTQWKHYRGGTHSVIWLYTRATKAVEVVPQPPDRPNDVYPMWIGDIVYFLSDRDGEFNLYSFDGKSRAVKRLTDYEDYPILWASAGAGKIVYEQAGYLYVYDPSNGRRTRLAIGVTADLPDTRPRFARGARFVRAGALSPSGARAVVEFRGEIVTVPAEKGDPRNLTSTPGVHERSPRVSPGRRSIACFSDAGGEYQLVVRAAGREGRGEELQDAPAPASPRPPAFSPDSKRSLHADKRGRCSDRPGDRRVEKIASEPV